MGELYPGGPVTLPCRVAVANTLITAQRIPAATIAYHAATGQWGALADRLFTIDDELRARLADPDDELDGSDLARAALLLTIRLSGAGDGIGAWRVMMHMCGVVVRDWLDIAGRLAATGTDPETAQLWRVVAAVRHLVTDGASAEYRAWVERTLEYPLPAEPGFVPGAGGLDAVRRRSAASFADLSRELAD